MLRPALIAILLIAPQVVAGQLPFPLAPSGTLRIGLHGDFSPAFSEHADGVKRELGAPVSVGIDQPMVADLNRRLGAILGRTVQAGQMGTVGADLEYQRGTGTIDLAVGISRRFTLNAALPIVSIRTQSLLTSDATDATLGINPALRGDPGSATYVEQLGVALGQLENRISAGDYDTDPALKAAAVALATDAPNLLGELDALLANPVTASAVLPLATSDEGSELLDRTNRLRDDLRDRFGITALTATLSLPTAPLTDSELGALLGASNGFDLAPSGDPPLVGLGDVRLGVTSLLLDGAQLKLWGNAGVTLPTGTAPRVRYLRDQGTGEHQFALNFALTMDAVHGALGLRATASAVRPFASDREARIGLRDQVLRPASRTTLLRLTRGNSFGLDLMPYARIAPSFALYGQLSYRRSGEDRWELTQGTTATSGGEIGAMGHGSGAAGWIAGLGLSYAHTGVNKDGVVKMPVEAGFGIARTVSSSSGIVADRVTTTLWFRIYKRLFTR